MSYNRYKPTLNSYRDNSRWTYIYILLGQINFYKDRMILHFLYEKEFFFYKLPIFNKINQKSPVFTKKITL